MVSLSITVPALSSGATGCGWAVTCGKGPERGPSCLAAEQTPASLGRRAAAPAGGGVPVSPEALAPSGGARCPVCRDRPFDGVAAQPPGAPHLPRTCAGTAPGRPPAQRR